tara:strand:- start:3148 stop:5835 length:2688 start_codon:yes stop_codon:yes gene_type:complete
MPMTNKLRVLIINDDVVDIQFLREKIRREGNDILEVSFFGPDEAGSDEVGRMFIKSLRGESNYLIGLNSFDVLFIDYAMSGLTGMGLLSCIPTEVPELAVPMVLITKREEKMMDEAIRAINLGARGYVFSDRDIFVGELEITAQRVFYEHQRERWAEALMEISSRLSTVMKKDDRDALIIEVLTRRNPTLKVFIRQLVRETNELYLRATTQNVSDEYAKKLRSFSSEQFPMLHVAVTSKQVTRYNSLAEIEAEIEAEPLATLRDLSLDKGMSFPLETPEGEVFGTISMYRREIDPYFTIVEMEYARLMIKSIERALHAGQRRREGEAYTSFNEQFALCKNEDELYRELVHHLHNLFHNIDDSKFESKTTFKILVQGTDKLKCQEDVGHHVGASRIASWQPRLNESRSISIEVARTNRPKRIPDLTKLKEGTAFLTNPKMRSELCLPVARSQEFGAAVLGVLNLECSRLDFYGKEDEEFALALCRLVGYRAELFRARGFLKEILEMLGQRKKPHEQIQETIGILRRLTGSSMITYILRHDDNWHVVDADIPLQSKVYLFKSEVEKRLNGEGALLLKDALEKGVDMFYEPDLNELSRDKYWAPEFEIDGQEYRSKSQAVFLMRVEEQVIGALSLDFLITNPLSSETTELLSGFTRWLGGLYIESSEHDSLDERVTVLEHEAAFAWISSQIIHKLRGTLSYIRTLTGELSEIINGESTNSAEKIKSMYEHIDELIALPAELQAVAKKPDISSIAILPVCEKVINELNDKARRLDVTITHEIPNNMNVEADADVLMVCVYNVLENALDASENSEKRCIHMTCTRNAILSIDIRIRDYGSGLIDPEQIMDLGYSTKPGGTGWGLYWTKKLLGQMGGEIFVEPREVGTEAILRLQPANELE